MFILFALVYIKNYEEKLINNKSFNDEDDLNTHIKIIEDEIKITDKDLRMKELKNWLDVVS